MFKLNQKGFAHIFIVLILVIGLVAGLYLVQKQTFFKPKAGNTGTRVEIIDKTTNQPFANGATSVRAVKLRLTYVAPAPATPTPTPAPTPTPVGTPTPTPIPTSTPAAETQIPDCPMGLNCVLGSSEAQCSDSSKPYKCLQSSSGMILCCNQPSVQGVSTAFAQTQQFPTHFRVSNDQNSLSSAQEFEMKGNPTEIDWELSEGAGQKTVFARFKVNDSYENQDILTDIITLQSPTTRSVSDISQTRTQQPTGLIGFWKLDEDTGTVATDSSGNAREGTYRGTSSIQGIFGNARRFATSYAERESHYVTLPDSISTMIRGGLTVTAYVKMSKQQPPVLGTDTTVKNRIGDYVDFFVSGPTYQHVAVETVRGFSPLVCNQVNTVSITDRSGAVYGVYEITFTEDYGKGFCLHWDPHGKRVRFRVNVENGGAAQCDTPVDSVPADTWRHVTATYDAYGDRGGYGEMTIYINGVQSAKCAHPAGGTLGTSNTYPLIGALRENDWGSLMSSGPLAGRPPADYPKIFYSAKGIIDEVAIYNRPLAGDEITRLIDQDRRSAIASSGERCNTCMADINKDGVVSILDFSRLTRCFNKASTNTSATPQVGVPQSRWPTESCMDADINGDGVVTVLDFSCLSTQFNKTCPENRQGR